MDPERQRGSPGPEGIKTECEIKSLKIQQSGKEPGLTGIPELGGYQYAA
jgi:hypothetical protein